MSKFFPFYNLIVVYCTYTLQLVYPFICWWTHRAHIWRCEHYCSEHDCIDICSSLCFQLFWIYIYIDEKLINQSEKEMETFIWVKFEDYNPGNASQDTMETVLPVRTQGTVMWVFWVGELYIKWCVIDSLHNPDLSPEWPLIKSRRNVIIFLYLFFKMFDCAESSLLHVGFL